MEFLLNVINVENSPSELYLYTVVVKFLSSHIRVFFFYQNGQNSILYVRDHSSLVLPSIPVSIKNISRGHFLKIEGFTFVFL